MHWRMSSEKYVLFMYKIFVKHFYFWRKWAKELLKQKTISIVTYLYLKLLPLN